MWYFHSHSAKATLSDNSDGSFQRHVCTDYRKYVSTEPKTRSLKSLNSKMFRSHSSVFIFKTIWYFYSNSIKAILSDTCSDSFQRHVCTEFQKLCFYWPKKRSFQSLNGKCSGPTPTYIYLKKYHIFTQIRQKRPSQTPIVARFRDTYALTSRK